MAGTRWNRWFVFILILLFAGGAAAQSEPVSSPARTAMQSAWTAAEKALQRGPQTIALRNQATLKLPEGYGFIPTREASELMEAMGNGSDDDPTATPLPPTPAPPTATASAAASQPITIEVGESPCCLAFGAGAVWAPNSGDSTISRIDSATNQVVATIDLEVPPADLSSGPPAIFVTALGEAIWGYRYDAAAVPTATQELVRIDRRVYNGLRELTDEKLAAAMGPMLTKPERQGVLARRDRILEFFDAKTAKEGAAAVICGQAGH